MQMFIDGPAITKHMDPQSPAIVASAGSCASLSLSQLVTYNTVKKRKSSDPTSVPRHIKQRETPLSIYLAIKIHTATRSRKLIDTLHTYGLCNVSRMKDLREYQKTWRTVGNLQL